MPAGTNDIKQFAQGGGANVLSQAAYEALVSILSNGYPAGILDSNLLNKTLRQSNFVAAAVAQMVADQGYDVLDDGDLATFAANLTSALVDVLSTAGVALLDVAQVFTKGQAGQITALVDAATIAVDLADSNNFSVTLGGNRLLGNPTNIVPGQSGVIVLTQDGAGSRLLSFDTYWKFANGAAPSLSTGPASVDYLTYYVETATRIYGSVVKDVS